MTDNERATMLILWANGAFVDEIARRIGRSKETTEIAMGRDRENRPSIWKDADALRPEAVVRRLRGERAKLLKTARHLRVMADTIHRQLLSMRA